MDAVFVIVSKVVREPFVSKAGCFLAIA